VIRLGKPKGTADNQQGPYRSLAMPNSALQRPAKAEEIAPLRYTTGPCTLGWLLLAVNNLGVCALLFADHPETLVIELSQRFARTPLQRDDHALASQLTAVCGQLTDPAQLAHLPLAIHGTALQERVWRALQLIPSGQTRSYGELAAQIGSHARSVASACARNPIALLVPCHRVIAANGNLSGYRWGVERKTALLAAEAGSLSAQAALI
jgi:AraC family transcriptional regulator of adaptative response/methylated-DNA-[protein]-cysteine methyltransferase